ncbi:type II secretion system protein GspG [Hoeflea prorocentri]|uniref:Type II secretion system protein GspG n=1 Tax=Hoeflea prorocentri TaxID=1922333 RepID=A0A9X3UG40_9HYPH|nr:type II secretion system protein GspG [Hoeflea prorocentri]MCY6380066.1 type II secretion system protein GspG [Hoeflea prorocentri]MDA5397866.1 type II secretion system protein GspG [Hoeflea prorocentri]
MSKGREKAGVLPYLIGGLSFIPLLGVVFGIIAIVWGVFTRHVAGRKVAIIGACGIAFTVVIYSALFYFGFVQRGGVYDKLRSEAARAQLTSLVSAIEFYKLENGAYPATLIELAASLPDNSMVFVYDPTDISTGDNRRRFYYRVLENGKYHLRSVGLDGKLFTEDDILPDIELKKDSRIGVQLQP